MHVTREGDYAVRVVVELAGHPPDSIVRTDDLTHATGVPRAYLKKIIHALAKANLVQTRQGPRGGVWLRRDPATITLREMIEAVEGPIHLNRCLVRRGECARDVFCPVHPVWARIQEVVVREMDGVTARALAESAGPAAHLRAGAPHDEPRAVLAITARPRPRATTSEPMSDEESS